MTIEDFIQNFTDQLDEEPVVALTVETKFRELDGWSSFVALSVMAMVDEEYNVQLTATEMRGAETIGQLFDMVNSHI